MSRYLNRKLSASANANRQNSWMSCLSPSMSTLIGPKRNFTGSLRELIWQKPRSTSGDGIRSVRSLVRPRPCACVNSKTFLTNRTLRRTFRSSTPWNNAIHRPKLKYLSLSKGSCQSWLLKTNLLLRKIPTITTITLWPTDASRSFSRKKLLGSTNMCIWGLSEAYDWTKKSRSPPWLTDFNYRAKLLSLTKYLFSDLKYKITQILLKF